MTVKRLAVLLVIVAIAACNADDDGGRVAEAGISCGSAGTPTDCELKVQEAVDEHCSLDDVVAVRLTVTQTHTVIHREPGSNPQSLLDDEVTADRDIVSEETTEHPCK